MRTAVIIPFRLRPDADPRRAANLEIVQAWWYAHGFEPQITDDGLEGDAQFNRHRAYNRAVSGNPDADVFVFTEADMLIHPDQVWGACVDALKRPGLVVPFTQYRYMSDSATEAIRGGYHDDTTWTTANWWGRKPKDPSSIFQMTPESTMDNGSSIGAVNVVSRETLEVTGGFTESTSGNWYDDRIIEEGFAYLTGNKTAFVPGPAVHMYHLPGHSGEHLSHADIIATANNKALLRHMRRDIRMGRPDRVRALMQVRKPTEGEH